MGWRQNDAQFGCQNGTAINAAIAGLRGGTALYRLVWTVEQRIFPDQASRPACRPSPTSYYWSFAGKTCFQSLLMSITTQPFCAA